MINQELLNQFKDILQKREFKCTPQRAAIFEEMINGHGHRECEEIYLELKKKGVNVSRATVYRTIDILVKNDIARKIEIGDGRGRYENKVNSAHHDHLICTSCGRIIEFLNQDIEDLQKKIAKRYHYKLKRHVHQLFGICKKCL